MKSIKKEKLELLQTSIPRELCKKCYNWYTQEDVGEHDIPHCINSDYCCSDYLRKYRNDCPKFVEL